MERARWNTELSYKKLNFESVQLLGFTSKYSRFFCALYFRYLFGSVEKE